MNVAIYVCPIRRALVVVVSAVAGMDRPAVMLGTLGEEGWTRQIAEIFLAPAALASSGFKLRAVLKGRPGETGEEVVPLQDIRIRIGCGMAFGEWGTSSHLEAGKGDWREMPAPYEMVEGVNWGCFA